MKHRQAMAALLIRTMTAIRCIDWINEWFQAMFRVMSNMQHLLPGQPAPAFERETLSHGLFAVPSRQLLHLQFRRFAGCPICSLHLRSFSRRYDELKAAGIQAAALFHSSLESLQPYHEDLPFPVMGDAEREIYRLYGVEASLAGVMHPRAMWAGMKGLVSAPSNPLAAEGGVLGLPADFLIAESGQIIALHYGRHADDQWSVDELLELAKGDQGS